MRWRSRCRLRTDSARQARANYLGPFVCGVPSVLLMFAPECELHLVT
jgi:hypothetical protein